MFQILKKSGLTGVPSPFTRSGSEEVAWTRNVLFFLKGGWGGGGGVVVVVIFILVILVWG